MWEDEHNIGQINKDQHDQYKKSKEIDNTIAAQAFPMSDNYCSENLIGYNFRLIKDGS